MSLLSKKLIPKSFSHRLRWVQLFFLAIVLIILLRGLHMQTVEKPALDIRADMQHNQTMSVKLQRGPILDNEGQILTVSLPMESIFAIPAEIENPQESARLLSQILHQPEERILRKLTANSSFVWIRRHPKPAVSQKIKELKFPGIYQIKEYQRFYPLKNHAAQLIGFSGIDSQGLEGLEYQYDKHLMASSDRHSIWSSIYNKPGLNEILGGSLELTINSKLQYYTEKELEKALRLTSAKHAVSIVMESQTGNILTIASIPDYDPNNFEKYDRANYFNRAVSAAYEPGSTFKIITVSSALENDIVSSENIFFCENGEYQIQDRVIHDVSPYGWLPLEKIIQKSSNICAAKIGQLIPKPIFYRMIREFGFGSKTGISLPGEASGKVFPYENWSDTDIVTMSYGHSISATPIQIITAINTIATGGVLISPNVIKEAKTANGQRVQMAETQKKRILKKTVSENIKSYMVAVVQEGGTGFRAKIKGITVAGKTGTSRKFDAKKQKYSSKNHIISFVGFFPAEDPKLTILVMVDEPQRKYLGSGTAAPVFKKIAEHALHLYPGQFPVRMKENTETGNESSAETIFKALSIPTPDKPQKRPNAKRIIQRLKNKTFRDVLLIAARENITVEVSGSGIARQITPDLKRINHYLVKLR
ncbi:MAG: penicillin-binding protein 2 [Deltaproteobacteria bacterium]|nr:penicillin-binding protein 2 [Deltaproteobacteria bacterium]